MICEYERKYEKNAVEVETLRSLGCEFQGILHVFTTYFGDLCLLSGIGRDAEAQLDPDKPKFE